jgi:hypothetical protein
MKSPERTQQMQGLGSFLESTGIPKTTERLAYGEPLTNISQANVPLLKPETADALLNVAPFAGEAAKFAKVGKNLPVGLSIMGESHPEWDKMMGDAAKMMEARGHTPEEIYQTTNTYKNKAGDWEQAGKEYHGSHKAPNAKEYGAYLHDLTGIMPKDVYTRQGKSLYGVGDPATDSEWWTAAMKAKGNPEAEVQVYRAVPKGIPSINSGDWVTTSPTYAKWHGENVLDGEYDILSKKVKAKTLSTAGDPQEYGYHEESALEKEPRK